MEISNAQEYQSIRMEMQNLKNCITNYLGFVLGGFGISFIGFYLIDDCKKADFESIAFISIILAITISMVLFIIYYKFNSHNRYAGYCKLLNQEQLNINKKREQINQRSDVINQNDIDITSWEICVTRLRESDLKKVKISDKTLDETVDNKIIDKGTNLKKVEIFDKTLDEMVDKKIIDKGTKDKIVEYFEEKRKFSFTFFMKGFFILLGYMFGFSTTKSWQFPLCVTAVFFSLSVIYITFSLYSVNQIDTIHWNTIAFLNSSLLYLVLLLVFVFMWAIIFMKLHRLVEGSLTVDAYCCKFLPIRYCFIKKKLVNIDYSLITLKDID